MRAGAWPPALVLAAGAMLANLGVRTQRTLELRQPLATTVPSIIDGVPGRTLQLSLSEARVAGVTNYLLRVYSDTLATDSAAASGFQIYVGYYDRQTQGRTIHSPKNCLPGAGWEALTSDLARVPTSDGDVIVNRYLIQNGRARALVFYWYQGRGRVAANEYAVKWNLLLDAALRRRSDEALVRVVVPVTSGEDAALALATRVARSLVPAVRAALPA